MYRFAINCLTFRGYHPMKVPNFRKFHKKSPDFQRAFNYEKSINFGCDSNDIELPAVQPL